MYLPVYMQPISIYCDIDFPIGGLEPRYFNMVFFLSGE